MTVDSISSGLIDGQLAGIMGLAFDTIAATGATPFWQALLNANQFTNPEFSFFITRFGDDPNAKQEEDGGVLTLGGTNQTFFQGDVDFQPFPSNAQTSFWLQTVSGEYTRWLYGWCISYGNSPVCRSGIRSRQFCVGARRRRGFGCHRYWHHPHRCPHRCC